MVIAPPSSHQSVSLGGADVEIAPALCASHGMIFHPGHRFYGRDHDHNIFIWPDSCVYNTYYIYIYYIYIILYILYIILYTIYIYILLNCQLSPTMFLHAQSAPWPVKSSIFRCMNWMEHDFPASLTMATSLSHPACHKLFPWPTHSDDFDF